MSLDYWFTQISKEFQKLEAEKADIARQLATEDIIQAYKNYPSWETYLGCSLAGCSDADRLDALLSNWEQVENDCTAVSVFNNNAHKINKILREDTVAFLKKKGFVDFNNKNKAKKQVQSLIDQIDAYFGTCPTSCYIYKRDGEKRLAELRAISAEKQKQAIVAKKESAKLQFIGVICSTAGIDPSLPIETIFDLFLNYCWNSGSGERNYHYWLLAHRNDNESCSDHLVIAKENPPNRVFDFTKPSIDVQQSMKLSCKFWSLYNTFFSLGLIDS